MNKTKSILDMAIEDLKFKIVILESIRNSNQMNDKKDAKIIIPIFEEMKKGNERIVNTMNRYLKNN
tara:strand:- start:2169 stop:2366 length:198 start_codon:yes stop_codon:yes gene_type:complete